MKRDKNKNIILALIDSFNYAINGLIIAVETERNMKIHYSAALIVLFLSMFFNFSRVEYILLLLTISFVIVAELMNTAIEKTIDLVTEDYHPLAKVAKDIAAGGVLLAAINSVAVGYLLFFDRLDQVRSAVVLRITQSPSHLTLMAILLVLVITLGLKALLKGYSKGSHLQGGAVSGHSSLAFCCATIISTSADNTIITILAYIMALLVAESRVEGKIHSTLEVVAGSLLGILVGVLIFQIL
ncbi:diacylglycerol kinase [Neofamilia massiliensis]|uniref:diacylglycerol kinase n=1 Tax=Neofamilia massiliensis TaxID=1673724 RepID=UPI0006BB90A3|nr:diacylglycerol kinase [Neofamilia massiliensis]